jgi:hypothetical protein
MQYHICNVAEYDADTHDHQVPPVWDIQGMYNYKIKNTSLLLSNKHPPWTIHIYFLLFLFLVL